jgi:hypothetical protein
MTLKELPINTPFRCVANGKVYVKRSYMHESSLSCAASLIYYKTIHGIARRYCKTVWLSSAHEIIPFSTIMKGI